MAPAGSSGVMSPKVISVAFSRTMEPQSAVGGWMPRPRKDKRADGQEHEAEAQAELGHQRRQDVRQDLAGHDPAERSPLSRAASTKSMTTTFIATARARRKTRVESSTAMTRMRLMIEVPRIESSTQREDQLRDRHQHVDHAAQHLVEPAAERRRPGGRACRRARTQSAVVRKAMPMVLRAP